MYTIEPQSAPVAPGLNLVQRAVTERMVCDGCDGSGLRDHPSGDPQDTYTCPGCNGSGLLCQRLIAKAVDKVVLTAPEKIWLQVDADDDQESRASEFASLRDSEVTWCSESQGGVEVAYVRADIYTAQQPGAQAAAWPSIAEVCKAAEPEDEAFSAWRNAVPDKHWVRLDLSALRVGYELGKALATPHAPAPPPDGRIQVWHEEIGGMVAGPSLVSGGDEWVRAEDHRAAIAALQPRAGAMFGVDVS